MERNTSLAKIINILETINKQVYTEKNSVVFEIINRAIKLHTFVTIASLEYSVNDNTGTINFDAFLDDDSFINCMVDTNCEWHQEELDFRQRLCMKGLDNQTDINIIY